ncbi:MAG: acetate--CoA ligase family protein, partial [candidate division Zixibacteria bacterium]|nr:acetate--CoA ligase family protein [candidate division Zixibacteria bacterium]
MPPGLDLMVGVHRDPQFGPVLVFGTGGQYVEIYKDIKRILLPATIDEIAIMVFKTHAGQILRELVNRA